MAEFAARNTAPVARPRELAGDSARPCLWAEPAGWLLLVFLLLLTGLRLWVAAKAPLVPDEAYYWIWSRTLAPGYLDHPPMVALWIWCGTAIAGPGSLGVRLLAPFSALFGSLLLVDAGECLLPNRHVGLIATALLNATLLFGVGSVLMTPDTPLLFFWTACLWAMARLVKRGRTHRGGAAWWLAAGLFAGLALDSDYTAGLLLVGVGLWLLLLPSQRHWLRHPAPWLGLLLAAVAFLPVVLWNAHHGWASIIRQGGRIGDWQPHRAPQFLGELVGAQFGLATPLVFVLCVGGTVEAVRRAWRQRDAGWSLLALLIVPGALVFIEHAIGDRVQGNWPAVLYPAAAIAAAGLPVAGRPRIWLSSVALGLAMTVAVYAQASFDVIPLPAHVDPVTRQMRGWDRLARNVTAAAQRDQAKFVAVPHYAVASELARAIPTGLPVIAVNPRWAYFRLPSADVGERTGLLLWPANGPGPDPAQWPGVHLVGATGRGTLSLPIEVFRMYEISGVPKEIPSARLPEMKALRR